MTLKAIILRTSAATVMAACFSAPVVPAMAQATCGGETTQTGDVSDMEESQTACGWYATTVRGTDNTAVGSGAFATDGPNTAIGAYANASGVNVDEFGPNFGSNTALGVQSNATGDSSSNLAAGAAAQASGNGSSNIAIGDGAVANGNDSLLIAIGTGAGAIGTNSIAMGDSSRALGLSSVAIGPFAATNGQRSVAIGNGSTANEDDTFAVGGALIKRRIVNVANGTIADGSTDAVTGDQLFDTNQRVSALEGQTAAAGEAQATADQALADAATAQSTAETALSDAAAAQDTADAALDRSDALGESVASALGGASAYNPVSGTISAPAYRVGTADYHSVGSALNAANTSGLAYFHTNATAPDGSATGENATAIGSATASAENSFAAGNGALASAKGALAVGAGAKATGVDAIAIGTGATATGSVAVGAGASAANGGAAFGDRSVATGAGSAALGPDATATEANAVAIGSGSVADEADTVSVGSATFARRITHLANGRAPGDAVNLSQLTGSTASIAAALGGGASVNAAGIMSAPTYDVDGRSYHDVGSALNGVSGLVYDIRREARSGIAAATAMATAPFPSAPGRTSYVANVAEFAGEVAFGLSLSHRLNTETDLALSMGYSRSTTGDDAFRAGLAGEF